MLDFKDHYSMLGVLKSADQEVIRSVYLALSKKYHPDVSSRPDAESFIRDLNEAYEVLGDPTKREEYDHEYDKSEEQTSSFRSSDQDGSVFDLIKEDWSIVTDYHPSLELMRIDLARLSADQALVFVITLLEEKDFKSAEGVKKSLEASFLRKFFGADYALRGFARRLLIEGRQDIALELNNAIRVLGTQIEPEKVKGHLIEKHELDPQVYEYQPTKWPMRLGREAFVEEYGRYGIYRMGEDKFFIYSTPQRKAPGSVTYSTLHAARMVIDKS